MKVDSGRTLGAVKNGDICYFLLKLDPFHATAANVNGDLCD